MKNDERITELKQINKKLKDEMKEQTMQVQVLSNEKQQISKLLETQLQSVKENTKSNEKLSNELILLTTRYNDLNQEFNRIKIANSKMEAELKDAEVVMSKSILNVLARSIRKPVNC